MGGLFIPLVRVFYSAKPSKSEMNTLTLHAIGGVVIDALVSMFYFRRYDYTTPLLTASFFVGFIIFMDVFVVSMLIMRSFEMFQCLTGTYVQNQKPESKTR